MKTILKRIAAGTLAAVFLATFAIPRAEAVTGVDDTTLGIMAVIVHLQSIGGELAVTQGTALATTDAVTSLATQAGAAGAFGAGVTGATALATIGAAVTAFAGGFTIGYVGYETLTKLAEWIRQSKLTGTAENKIFSTDPVLSAYEFLSDGTAMFDNHLSYVGPPLTFGEVYTFQSGSSFYINKYVDEEEVGTDKMKVSITTITPDNSVYYQTRIFSLGDGAISEGTSEYYFRSQPTGSSVDIRGMPTYKKTIGWVFPTDPQYAPYVVSPGIDGVFKPYFDDTKNPEKQEVTYVPPATWSPPVPSLGQDVLYQPYPNQPDKSLKDIAQDVPKDIYDKQLSPLPPVVITPETPPVPPDIPPVNPNPDVETPEDVTPYTVKIGEVFPFCIPFDLYHMVTMFAAEPEAPHAKWEFSLPWSPQEQYEVEWDLEEFDTLAELCRKLELVLFCVGLAVITSRLIKW